MRFGLTVALASVAFFLSSILVFEGCDQGNYIDGLSLGSIEQCAALEDETSCEAAGNGYVVACLWAEAGDAKACVPNYNFCAQLNSDPALKGQSDLLKAACAININTSVFSYSCIYHPEGNGSCGGDCRPPVVNCQNLTPKANTNQCGEDGTLESLLCEYNSDGGCQIKNDVANAALKKCTEPGPDASRDACTKTPAIAANAAYKCVWGGWQRDGSGTFGRRRR
jgi:hypothetical protein